MEEVFEQLKCSKQGLTTEEGEKRLQIFGPNKLEEKKVKEKLKISQYLNWVCLIYETSCVISNVSKTSFFFNHFLLGPTETGEQVAKVLRFYVESSLMGHGDCCTDGYWIGQWRGIFFFFLFSWPLASYIYFCLLVCALFFVIEIYFFLITAMQGKPPDWQDFIGIVVLLLINSTISFIEENNAGNAAAALMAGLAPKTKVVANFGWLQDPPWFKLVKSEWGCSNMGHEGLVHVYRSRP